MKRRAQVEAEERGPFQGTLDRADRLLERFSTRLVLSALILLSILPLEQLVPGVTQHTAEYIDLGFFCIFAPEFLVRAAVYFRRRKRGETRGGEFVLLVLDLLATLSFLPIESIFPRLPSLRLVRLVRMVLLFGYWGGVARDLWSIVTRRERRFQVVSVVALGAILSLTGAVVLFELSPGASIGEDGTLDSFSKALWWSFRQVEDPGNLVRQPTDVAVVVVSVLLTFAGLLLLSFLIGIGTSAIAELLARARHQPVGMRDHTVVLGAGEETHLLLEQFTELYDKNSRRVRAAVMGASDAPPDYLREPALARFEYRKGDPADAEDLDRIDIKRAKRVLILGQDPRDPDAEVISAILAIRDRNADVDLFADLDHEKNLRPARTAGGPKTHVIGSGSFLGHYIAQNVIYPGVHRLYRQLLTSVGCEIYTYVYLAEERVDLAAAGELAPAALYARAYTDHGVTLLGFFVAPDPDQQLDVDDLEAVLHPLRPSSAPYAFSSSGGVRGEALRGVIGISRSWEAVRRFALEVVSDPAAAPADATDESPELLLDLPSAPPRDVLICGGSERVPRIVTELVKFAGGARIAVLVRDPARLVSLEHDIVSALAGAFSANAVLSERRADHSPSVRVEQGGDDQRRIVVHRAGGDAVVTVRHSDWTDAVRMIRHPAVDLSRTDAVVFTPPVREGEETDGLVALDCLQLADLGVTGAITFPPSFRVIGMVQDPVKGDLLESRLEQMARRHGGMTYTLVAGRRVRHHFVMQNLFVRGMNAIALELLDSAALSLCRVVPRTPGGGRPVGTFDPWALARGLLTTRGVVFVGLETIDEDGGVEVRLDPAELGPGTTLEWDTVAAIYVMGDGREFLDDVT